MQQKGWLALACLVNIMEDFANKRHPASMEIAAKEISYTPPQPKRPAQSPARLLQAHQVPYNHSYNPSTLQKHNIAMADGSYAP